MTIDSQSPEPGSTATSTGGGGPRAAAAPAEGSATRRRILEISLSLMSQRGVDGTSMRDLASACDLNVASLYHYFPSKRELLEAVLVEHGFLPVHAPRPDPRNYGDLESPLAQLLADVLVSMFEVEDFVRLMVGEAIRSESTARSVGLDLFTTFQSSIEGWIAEHRPDLAARAGAGPVARMLSAMVVGVFIEYASGAIEDGSEDLLALSLQRAREAAEILAPPPA
ncbi:MAG TPA: helix-turn-helix domain-containing protein [Acidimicrobiales bacterium]|jgi:AcrR family transcriptional regulator|nr:helix-turn-helix domain-containing protein [Acidimicrobiales bacterium]